MSEESPYVLTISRMLGSGGSELGHRVATRLDLAYVDREILRRAAEKLGTSEEDLQFRDERVSPIWQSLLASFMPGMADINYMPPIQAPPTDREIMDVESGIIRELARTRSCVIVGRGGFHVLRDHPKHLSVLLYADLAFRRPRIERALNISAEKAEAMIRESDTARTKYAKSLTGREWTDLRQFHLTINTGVVGLDAAENIVIDALGGAFRDIKK